MVNYMANAFIWLNNIFDFFINQIIYSVTVTVVVNRHM